MDKILDSEEISQLALKLGVSLKQQRNKFLNHLHQSFLKDFPKIEKITKKKYRVNIDAVSPVVKAFQVNYLIPLIPTSNYLTSIQMNEFMHHFMDSFSDKSPCQKMVKYVQKYENLRMQLVERNDLALHNVVKEQIPVFCDDILYEVSGEPFAKLYGAVYFGMAMQFFYINWGILADDFGDSKTTEFCMKIAQNIYNKKES